MQVESVGTNDKKVSNLSSNDQTPTHSRSNNKHILLKQNTHTLKNMNSFDLMNEEYISNLCWRYNWNHNGVEQSVNTDVLKCFNKKIVPIKPYANNKDKDKAKDNRDSSQNSN